MSSSEEFINDLIDDDELSQIIRMPKRSIQQLRCRGLLSIPGYRVNKKKFLTSKKAAVEWIKARRVG